MAESDNNSVNHPVKQTKLGKFLTFILKIIGVLIFSALISIIIEWIGMGFYYPDEGFGHAEKMLYQEMEFFTGEDIPSRAAQIDAGNFNAGSKITASEFINWIQKALLMDDGLVYAIKDFAEPNTEDNAFMVGLKRFISDIYSYLVAAILIFVMFCIRLSILFLSIPAFLLFGIVGMVDGLMQRDLRRWTGGNESAFIYHWAKRFSVPILFIGWIIYLAIPTSIHPNYIITPCAIAFGTVVMVMASKFKKYL